MADLADKIDDLICTFDGTLNASIDTLAMYIFGVFVFVLFVLVLVFHVYGKNRISSAAAAKRSSAGTTASSIDEGRNQIATKNGLTESHRTTTTTTTTNATAGKVVPSSPTVRRRLGSKSGNMANIATAPTKGGRATIASPPSATGADVEAAQWVNALFGWLYSDAVIVNELVHQWIQTLNETMKPAVAEHGVGVELIRMLPETNAPSLNNVFCECAPNDDIKITCDCEATPAMQLKALRQKSDKVETFHYRVNVSKLRSRLNITCITEKLQVRAKFDGWPEIKVILAQVGSLRSNTLDEQSLQELIADIVASALRNTSVNFNLSAYPTCPRFARAPVPPAARPLPLHYDSLLSASPTPRNQRAGQTLMVKVVRGSALTRPPNGVPCDQFCVIEVDAPPQTNQTKSVRGSDSPYWNEQLVFNVSPRTKEIMFEVYNRGASSDDKNTFLGLAIVSVQELMESATQRQVISLQSRPYQNDRVTGTLTLEFAFADSAELYNGSAAASHISDEKPYFPTAARNAPSPKPTYSSFDYVGGMSNGATTRPEASRSNATPDKTTLSLRGIQKPSYLLTPPNHESRPLVDDSGTQSDDALRTITRNGESGSGAGRGRARKRRDFFGTIRKRLNRSRSRAKSGERNGYVSDTTDLATNSAQPSAQVSRAISVDRTLLPDTTTTAPLKTHHLLLREGSTRSSLSEMSGASGASSRTYLNEASTLVLETVENGLKKYYLVPLSLAQKNKWKKKGTKLHIFNEHVFVAKHLAGGTACEVCARTLPRRLGKQGYECRDCQLKCHKRCHVQTDVVCPSSSVPNLELADVLTQSE
jgi:hypothetical protein